MQMAGKDQQPCRALHSTLFPLRFKENIIGLKTLNILTKFRLHALLTTEGKRMLPLQCRPPIAKTRHLPASASKCLAYAHSMGRVQ